MNESVEGLIVLALFAVITLAAWGHQNAKLQNSEDFSVVYTDQLFGIVALVDGSVEAVLIRLSGNVYKELGRFDDWNSALTEVLKSFNRAKIDSVMIRKNSSTVLDLQRAFRSHGGKAEGRKLGGAVIRLV